MIGKVYIKGQIGGTFTDENGTEKNGVTLTDVVSQVQALKGHEEIHVYIDSPGGSVEVGDSIAEYLKELKGIKTIASNLCASIATKIHLSAEKENRFIEEGTIYMIHNPLFTNISGNANELKEMAAYLEPIEKDLVNMYSKTTGLEKSAIKGMMKQETEFTATQAVELGFASKVLSKMQYKAVAFIDKSSINLKKEKMSKMSAFAKLVKNLADFAGVEAPAFKDERVALNVMFTGEGGNVMTPFEDLMVGDPVTMEDGTEANPGTYVSEDGSIQITVAAGVVETIEQLNPDGDLSIQVVALKEQIANLEAKLAEKEEAINTMTTEQVETQKVLEAVNAKIASNFKPAKGPVAFRKPLDPVSVAKTAEEVKAEAKAKREAYK
jgi:ATP-dependent protease ClpP protease subunit